MTKRTSKTMAESREYPAALKAKVALEALREEHTIAEIASRHGIHPNLVTSWKKQARESMTEVFAGGAGCREASEERRIQELHAKIGELTVERDFLAKGLAR